MLFDLPLLSGEDEGRLEFCRNTFGEIFSGDSQRPVYKTNLQLAKIQMESTIRENIVGSIFTSAQGLLHSERGGPRIPPHSGRR